ncbi:hypothetical protein EK0264_00265 [Epidermidibacterium keratini]|uniref:Uncharacterized protein n=1 Tax=Epidermidibacterium keratini TaxID=1891644 RepID=A0A7L4YK13_9ACTN|nr:hypothetical protein [Epidermidibacterium keratini]QHB98886.1 hypothetical protein EK0264_00265 [Epidermidibacterium keratini]
MSAPLYPPHRRPAPPSTPPYANAGYPTGSYPTAGYPSDVGSHSYHVVTGPPAGVFAGHPSGPIPLPYVAPAPQGPAPYPSSVRRRNPWGIAAAVVAIVAVLIGGVLTALSLSGESRVGMQPVIALTW